MRILFDQGTPAPLRYSLSGHVVATASEMGWGKLSNGDLLRVAEGAFDLLITTDQNLSYQQNLSSRQLAIIVLLTTSWPRIQRRVSAVVAAVDAIKPGDFCEIAFPR